MPNHHDVHRALSRRLPVAALACAAAAALLGCEATDPAAKSDGVPDCCAGKHAEKEPADEAVDLLKAVDPAKHAVKGTWKLDGGALICPTTRTARIAIPAKLADEYVLRLTVERLTGDNSLVVGVPLAGDRRAVVVLGAKTNDGPVCGFELVDGLAFYSNETSNTGVGFAQNKPARVEFVVKKTGVAVTVDGKAATSYEGEFTRLTEQTWWQIKDPRGVMLGGWDTQWKITRVEVGRAAP